MRNGQQKRMRGRNNRRSSNPMTRVYESNGPDVKVRGTAHHIAEKYQQLARDAQSSGDHVAAENYYQHAEHYQRLIAALQGQLATQPGFGREDDMEDDEMEDGGFDAPQPNYQPREQQREQNYQPREGQRQQRDNRQNGNQRRQRDDEGGEGNYQPREFRGQRRDDDQQGNYAPRPPREPRYPREEGGEGYAPRPPRQPREEGEGYAARQPRQPREEGEGGYAARAPRQPREEGEGYAPRPAREPREPREPRQPRPAQDDAAYAPPVPAPAAAPAPAPRASRARKEREEVQQPELGLPSFITGGTAAPVAKERATPPATEEGGEDSPRFTRRRRRFRGQSEEGAEGAAPAAETGAEPQFDN